MALPGAFALRLGDSGDYYLSWLSRTNKGTMFWLSVGKLCKKPLTGPHDENNFEVRFRHTYYYELRTSQGLILEKSPQVSGKRVRMPPQLLGLFSECRLGVYFRGSVCSFLRYFYRDSEWQKNGSIQGFENLEC